MRMHLVALVLPILACAPLLNGCSHSRATNSSELVTIEPAEVSPRITKFADEDRDGYVTRKEAKADPALVAEFDKYDANEDDKLDRAEFARLEGDNARGDKARNDRTTTRTSGACSGAWEIHHPDGAFGSDCALDVSRDVSRTD